MSNVGRGNPPVASRFKKGFSGNPKGRPKKIDTFEDVVIRSLNKIVRYTANGQARNATRWELFIMKLSNEFMLGNVSAGKIILRLQKKAAYDDPPEIIINVYNALPD